MQCRCSFRCRLTCGAVEPGLISSRLVIFYFRLGLTAAIKRIFKGCSCQRCREHFLRNLLSYMPKACQDMVVAAMKAVLVIQAPDQVRAHCHMVTENLYAISSRAPCR